MKSKLALLVLALAAFGACASSQNYVQVQANFPMSGGVSLDKVDKIYLLDFLVELNDKSYDPTEQIRRYLSDDFAAYIGKKVVPVPSERWNKLRQQLEGTSSFSFNSPTFFQDLLAGYPQAIFLTGRIKGEVKTTSVIREGKDEKGEKRNVFVQQRSWDTEALAVLIDAGSGKLLLEKVDKQKASVDSSVTFRFQFDRILEMITEKLSQDIQRRSRRQERYLILQ